VGIAAVVLTVMNASRNHYHGWYVPVLLLFVPLVAVGVLKVPTSQVLGEGFRSISQSAAAVGTVGCVFVAVTAIRRSQWGRAIGILPVALLLLVGIYQVGLNSVNMLPTMLPTYLNLVASIYQGLYWASPAMAAVIYGLWLSRGGDAGASGRRQRLLRAWAVVLAGQIVAVALLITPVYGRNSQTAAYGAALWGVAGLVVVAFVATMLVAIREGQWGWALVMVVYLILQDTVLPGSGISLGSWQLDLQTFLLTVVLPTGLCYALWVPWATSTSARVPTAAGEVVAVAALGGAAAAASGE
jgi:hypothetical protein